MLTPFYGYLSDVYVAQADDMDQSLAHLQESIDIAGLLLQQYHRNPSVYNLFLALCLELENAWSCYGDCKTLFLSRMSDEWIQKHPNEFWSTLNHSIYVRDAMIHSHGTLMAFNDRKTDAFITGTAVVFDISISEFFSGWIAMP